MEINEKAQKAIEMVKLQGKELSTIAERVRSDNDFSTARERLRRWKSRTKKLLSEQIHPDEAAKLKKMRKTSFIAGQPLRNFVDETKMYRGFILSLREELEKHPQDVLLTAHTTDKLALAFEAPQPTASRTVFIVHGRDELNILRLEKLLRERWHLEPICLTSKPGKGRTLIEKFEQEAQRATYAIALFTPDDLIKSSDTEYTQARPNVIFELGWFYGRLARERVCILFKKGTRIHSDLEGIMRIEFDESVEEKVMELEKELKEVGLL